MEIAGYEEDKIQITATFASYLCSNTGEFLPMQILYTGKTDRCIHSTSFPVVLIFTIPLIIGQMKKLW